MDALTKALADLFAKLPHLPQSAHRIVVKLTPWANLLGLLLALPAIFSLIGLGALAGPLMSMGGSWAYYYGYGVIFAIALTILHGLAAKPLFDHKASGWQYLYYSILVAGLESLLMGDIVGLIIGTGISLYLLFEVRPAFRA